MKIVAEADSASLKMELAPAVIGLLSILGAGVITAVLMVTLCVICNKCCPRDCLSLCCSCDELEQGNNNLEDSPNAEGHNSQQLLRQNCNKNILLYNSEVDSITLNGSVLSEKAPPSYQMATSYPTVGVGQCYVGTIGEIEVQLWSSLNADHLLSSDSEQPPNYNLVVTH